MAEQDLPGNSHQPVNRRAMIVSSAIVLVAILFVGAVLADFFISQHEASQEVRQLCGIINLVADKPVPKPTDPSANPSRVDLYDFYLAFKQVQSRYGC